MLRWRLLTALLLAPIVLLAIALGRWTILAAILLVVGCAAYELARALELPFLAALGAGVLPILLSVPYGASGILAGAMAGLPWALLWLVGQPAAHTVRAVLAIFLMALWVGAPLAHLGLLERLPDGGYLVLVAVVGPWVSDAGAYFAGRLLGRHKLFPLLSPKKTYEGAVGGLLLTVAAAGFFTHIVLGFNATEAVLTGVVISVFSQAGDFFESALKRILEVKDLGSILPGHGGILDRIDSLLFAAPALYYLFALFV